MTQKEKKLSKTEKKLQKKERAREFHLTKEVAKIKKGLINPQVANLSHIPDYDEDSNSNLLFSFVHYNRNQCELGNINNKEACKLIEKLQQINNTTIEKIPNYKLERDSINRSGKYKGLYTNLSKDIDIREIKFAKEGRIFYHRIRKYIYLVAIKIKHI